MWGKLSKYTRFYVGIKSLFNVPSSRYPALDGIRALSIISVVIYHSYLFISTQMNEEAFRAFTHNIPDYLIWITRGDLGVDIFFVLSGFLIGNLLLREYVQYKKINFKRFYIRRLLRLYPAYLFVILIAAIGLYITSANKLAYLWADVFYVSNFLSMENMALIWSWSLSVEEQFYLITPVLIVFGFRFVKNPLYWMIGLYLFSFVIRYLALMNNPGILITDPFYISFPTLDAFDKTYFETMYINLYTRYGALIVGVLASYLHVYHAEKVRSILQCSVVRNNCLFLAAVISIWLLVGIRVYSESGILTTNETLLTLYHVANRNIFSLCIGLIILCLLYPAGLVKNAEKLLSLRFWFPIAQLSYSIYMTHLLFVGACGMLLLKLISIDDILPIHILMIALASLLSCAVLASFLFVLIEKPFLKLRSQLDSRASRSVFMEVSMDEAK